MLLKGDVLIHAPRKIVGDFLTDPKQIGQYGLGSKNLKDIHEAGII